jgi:hypothetical protein
VGVRHRVMFGSLARVKQVLAATGWQINTASLNASTSPFASMSPLLDGVSPHCANTRMVCGSSWRYSRPITTFACLTPAYVSRCLILYPPRARAQPKYGSRRRQRWQRDSRITSGIYEPCCSIACRRGHRRTPCKGLERTMIVQQCGSVVPAIRQREGREVLKSRVESA